MIWLAPTCGMDFYITRYLPLQTEHYYILCSRFPAAADNNNIFTDVISSHRLLCSSIPSWSNFKQGPPSTGWTCVNLNLAASDRIDFNSRFKKPGLLFFRLFWRTYVIYWLRIYEDGIIKSDWINETIFFNTFIKSLLFVGRRHNHQMQ